MRSSKQSSNHWNSLRCSKKQRLDFSTVNQAQIPGLSPTGLWCVILLHIIVFVLLRIFASQLTLEQHEFELCGSTYMWIFSILQIYFPYEFLSNILFSLANFIVRIQYIIHMQNCVHQLFMLSIRLPVNSRFLGATFFGGQKLYEDF